ncbi:hypothetical protein FALCPG4_004250 [Fusarium falciforme]
MFGSWKTLWHCLTLASLAIADTSFLGLNDSSHELIHAALRQLSITSAADFPGEVVLNNTFECALASCNSDKKECKMRELDASYIVDGRVQLNVLGMSLLELCEGLEVEIDADIAGPGVVISYIFQAAMAVYVWAFIALPSSRYVPSALKRTFSTLWFKIRSFTGPFPALRSLWLNLIYATSTFLVEFHEAQCFLVASIEIALLYAKSRSLPSESANWGNLDQFRNLIQLVGATGAWSVILTQTSLRRARLNSVYNLALSTVALVLATAAVSKTTDLTADEAYRLFKGLNHISECGGNTSLRSFCAQHGRYILSPLPPGYIYLCVVSVITTWLYMFVDLVPKMAWADQMYRRLAPRQRRTYRKMMGVLDSLDYLLFLGFDGFIIGSLLNSLMSLGALQRRVGADEWGIGQVIAVLIWAPVLSKYLYLIIFGMEKGFLYRLSHAFMVVKRPSETKKHDEDIATGDTPDSDNVPLALAHRHTAAW